MQKYTVDEVSKAAKVLRAGGLLLFPTETVYGLGCKLGDKKAYEKLVAAKKRPPEKPFTVMFSSLNEVYEYYESDLRSRLLMDRFFPGEVTMLLKAKKGIPHEADLGTGVIGVRIPDDPLALALLTLTGPCLVTSANHSGDEPAKNAEEAMAAVPEADAIVVGECKSKVPSTVVDLSVKGKIKLVREGGVPFEKIKDSYLKRIVLALASDHAGYKYKEAIKKHLIKEGYEVNDLGTDSPESCDYPYFGIEAGKEVAHGEADYGILVCSSGEGIAIAANKVKGIRCAIGYNDEVAKLARAHNRANMIAFGANFMDLDDVIRRVDIFLSSHFERGRHARRVAEITDFENE